jgi:hypothetical protein
LNSDLLSFDQFSVPILFLFQKIIKMEQKYAEFLVFLSSLSILYLSPDMVHILVVASLILLRSMLTCKHVALVYSIACSWPFQMLQGFEIYEWNHYTSSHTTLCVHIYIHTNLATTYVRLPGQEVNIDLILSEQTDCFPKWPIPCGTPTSNDKSSSYFLFSHQQFLGSGFDVLFAECLIYFYVVCHRLWWRVFSNLLPAS